MTINSIKLTAPEPLSPIGLKRQMLPTKEGSSESPPPPEPSNSPPLDSEETANAIRELSEAVQQFNISLRFTSDEATGTIVVEVVDQASGETLDQFPNEARLHLAATLSKLQGNIFNVQV